jgi:hypothetical protein
MSNQVDNTKSKKGSKSVLPALVENTNPNTENEGVSDETVKKLATIMSENRELVTNSRSFSGTARVLNFDEMPDLSKAKPKKIDLSAEYWSPEIGETKVVVFMRIVEDDSIPDFNDNTKTVSKDCAYFVTKNGSGDLQVLKCAATRLVSAMSSASEGDIFQIAHTGKVKNKTNNYLSSEFRINPVVL